MPEPSEPTSLEERRAAQAAARAERAATQPATAHMTRRAIANCRLCNADGYRGRTVCDHVDHATGRAAVRQVLADIAARKTERARGTTPGAAQ